MRTHAALVGGFATHSWFVPQVAELRLAAQKFIDEFQLTVFGLPWVTVHPDDTTDATSFTAFGVPKDPEIQAPLLV
jgi:hypothetical protein